MINDLTRIISFRKYNATHVHYEIVQKYLKNKTV